MYYGDNLHVLRRYIKDESVDLVYLDPPFKSNQDCNVLFAEKDGSAAAAQFKASGENGSTKQIILSVKSGHVGVKDVRDLRGVIEREKAEIGVLITLEEATKPMRTEASAARFYKSPWGSHPRLQILTVAEVLEGEGIEYPHVSNVTFKRAPRAEAPQPEQLTLAAAPVPLPESRRTAKPRRRTPAS